MLAKAALPSSSRFRVPRAAGTESGPRAPVGRRPQGHCGPASRPPPPGLRPLPRRRAGSAGAGGRQAAPGKLLTARRRARGRPVGKHLARRAPAVSNRAPRAGRREGAELGAARGSSRGAGASAAFRARVPRGGCTQVGCTRPSSSPTLAFLGAWYRSPSF